MPLDVLVLVFAVALSWAFIAAVSRSPQPVAALIRGQRFAQFSSLRRCTCEGWQPARKAALSS